MPNRPTSDTVRHRVALLAKLLDSRFRLPGTKFRFGWDGLIGLLPGADLLTALPSLYILFEARRAKMPLVCWQKYRPVGHRTTQQQAVRE